MIDKNQLRLGNIVTWQDEEEVVPLIITGIMDGDDVWVEMTFADGTKDGTDCDYSSLKPIPITPEILKNIGNPDTDGWIYLPDNFRVCCAEVTNLCNFSMGMTEIGSDEIDWFVIATPEHLHQLQNLFYCLTGRELNFKP